VNQWQKMTTGVGNSHNIFELLVVIGMRIAGEDVPGLRTEESWAKVGERNIISNGWGAIPSCPKSSGY
jgi:hypothetical protein